ncbi:DUF3850 domain-containing protein [Bacillus altitudinis]|uniref:DUF3850 domain-containing protein n=1 Tax=Bacillus altitudinis TaxID=293387 RepID=UPI003F772EF6
MLNYKVHDLKINPDQFWAMRAGIKDFEIRANDREFKVNDVVKLREFNGVYTGRIYLGRITFITPFGNSGDYVVLNFKRIKLAEAV